MFSESDVRPPDTVPGDVRIGHLLGRLAEERVRCVLAGFPVDEGVRRNGGRVGAADAPDAIRRRLYAMTPDPRSPRFSELLAETRDLGNLTVTGDLELDQARLGAALAPYLTVGATVVVLGGGHETSYGHFLGYVSSELEVAVMNWDAHPDVRPLKDGLGHSGSPFRQMLDHPSGACRGYTVAGLQPGSVSTGHLRYLESVDAELHWCTAVDPDQVDHITERLGGPALVSFDLDVVGQAFAPGVSAPSVDGLAPALLGRAAYLAGRNPAVRSVDFVEVNPLLDRDEQTSRLAAWLLWRFLEGLAHREGEVTGAP